MNRAEKQAVVTQLQDEIGKASHAIVVDYRGLSVNDATEFRRQVRKAGSRYRVVKNSLALRALEGTAFEKLGGHFDDMTGVAYGTDDPVALAKALVGFAKTHPAIKVKGGLVEGDDVLDAEGVKALSALPSLPELRSMLLGVLQAPSAKLVRLLNTPATQLAQVLKQHQEKLGEKG